MSSRSSHDEADWTTLRDADDPFGDPRYLRVIERAGSRANVAVGSAGADGAHPAVAMVSVRKLGPFRQAALPALTPYTALSPIQNEEAAVHGRESSLDRLGADLERQFDDILLHLPPRITDVRPLQWRGWTVEPRYTYRLTPSGSSDPASWSAGPRRTWKQHRSSIVVEEGPDHAAPIARLCSESYIRRGRRPPLEPDAMVQAARELAATPLLRCFLALDEQGSPAAGIGVLMGSTTAFYWMAGGQPGGGMTVLLGAVLSALADDGIRTLDLVGANTPSIAEFKRRFGARLVSYHAARYTPSAVLRLARAVRLVRRP